ncbi:MAG: ankyrin repeat domain-containing protein, partial [Pseudomonadota bacterium]
KARGDDAVDLNPRDRWGGTPLDDAYLHGNDVIIEMLEQAGGRRGRDEVTLNCALGSVAPSAQSEAHKAAELIWAASSNNLMGIRRLVAQGTPLDLADYDLRSPLHLAAAEGHDEVVSYFLAQDVDPNPRDRWGDTPLDDAVRHGRGTVVDVLERAGARSGQDRLSGTDGVAA